MFWNTSAPQAKPEPQPLYTFNNQGWRSYDIERMDLKQSIVVQQSCKEEASSERLYAIGVCVGTALLGIGSIFAAIAIAKITTFVFLATIIEFEGVFALQPLIGAHFCIKIMTFGAAILFEAIALKRLFINTLESFNGHRNYAKYLDQQAIDAQLRKAKLENPAV